MVLSDAGIKAAIERGEIEIDPDPIEYSPSAVDLLLGDEFQSWDADRLLVPGISTVLDLAEQRFPLTAAAYLKDVQRERDGSVVFPPFCVQQSHMLAITRERVHLKMGSRVAARVEGRSSLARLGLMVHITAPTVHAGWNGRITLEMVNLGPFHLNLFRRKLAFASSSSKRLESDPGMNIATDFQGQTKPSGVRRATAIKSNPIGKPKRLLPKTGPTLIFRSSTARFEKKDDQINMLGPKPLLAAVKVRAKARVRCYLLNDQPPSRF